MGTETIARERRYGSMREKRKKIRYFTPSDNDQNKIESDIYHESKYSIVVKGGKG